MATTSDNGIQSTTPDEKGQEELARAWQKELDAAEKRESKWRKDAAHIVEIYEGSKHEEIPFNILYSNTETLSPAIYNEVPRPQVRPRFKDQKNEVVKHAARVSQRLLEFFLDSGESEYPSFDTLIKKATLAALVPGRGLTQFAYHSEVEEVGADDTDPEAAAVERVSYETVCGRDVEYSAFLHGFATTWKEVPWVAFGFRLTREEVEKNYGAEKSALVNIEKDQTSANGDTATQAKKDLFSPSGAVADSTGTALTFIIWDKVKLRLIHVSPNAPGVVLKEEADPLGLSAFYPCPQPLQLFAKISSLLPTPLYQLYRQQAKELNTITVRIGKITEALKVRGFYDSQVQGIDAVIKADDNTLVPLQDAAVMTSQGRKMEDAIFLMPIDKLVAVLQQLYTQRMQIKAIIFEITGIADIMRGASQASETLGAQEIKNQWGTLRLKRMQKEVARYCRDALRIELEIAVTKLGQETIARMTGLTYDTQAEREQQQQQLQMIMQLQQQSGAPPPPEMQQQLQAAQQKMSEPTWEQILDLLRNDALRSFNIDIETNSTVDLEATEDKKDLAELLNAVSQYLNGVAPLIENGTMPFEVAQSMLITILRRFRLGDDVEDQLKKMQPPQPKDDGKAKAMEAKAAMDKETHDADMQQRQQEAGQRQQEMQMEMELKQQEHGYKMQELARKAESDAAKHQMQMQQLAAQTQATVVAAEVAGQVGQQKLMQQSQNFDQQRNHREQMNRQQVLAARKPKPTSSTRGSA